MAEGEQVVTPWEAKAGEGQAAINYDKLIGISDWKAGNVHYCMSRYI